MMLIYFIKFLLRNLFFFRFINVMRKLEFKFMIEMVNYILLFVLVLVFKVLVFFMIFFCIEFVKFENVSILLKIYMGVVEFVYMRFLLFF